MVLCLIVGCGNKTGKIWPATEKVSFFRVPRVVVNQGEYMEELTTERRRRWISAICRENLRAALYKYQLSSFGREKIKFLKLSQMNGLDK